MKKLLVVAAVVLGWGPTYGMKADEARLAFVDQTIPRAIADAEKQVEKAVSGGKRDAFVYLGTYSLDVIFPVAAQLRKDGYSVQGHLFMPKMLHVSW